MVRGLMRRETINYISRRGDVVTVLAVNERGVRQVRSEVGLAGGRVNIQHTYIHTYIHKYKHTHICVTRKIKALSLGDSGSDVSEAGTNACKCALSNDSSQ